MENSILKFAEQFNFKPEIKNSHKLKSGYKNVVLGGMGGSHLAGGILRTYKPGLNIYIHRDYGLPKYEDDFLKESLMVACSYSGNTEEIIDFLDEGYSRGLNIVVIATGGKTIDFAKEKELPYIEIPNTGIQPRMALGYSTIALASLVDLSLLPELSELANTLKPEHLKEEGKDLAENLENKIPIIYTSNQNRAIGYNWKIKINETGKVPAFHNVFPELNHNEIQGFDVDSKILENFHLIFIKNSGDNERIGVRMDATEEILQKKGLAVTTIYMEGNSSLEKIFNSLLLADWTAFFLAKKQNKEPEQVPLIEEFKNKIS